MNWDMIGAVAELLGAIGVVASLIYVATQLKLASNIASESAYRDLFTHMNHHFHEMLAPENRKILLAGYRDLSQLDAEQHMVFDLLMISYLNMVESSLLSNEADVIGDDLMGNWSHHVSTRCMCYPGAVEWWKEAKPLFDRRTQKWIDDRIANTSIENAYWKLDST